jgi:predicted nucleotide-binding protein (sugar kinase/HSP70/actin superfamily)
MEQGIEVVMPTFFEFFAGGLVNLKTSVRTNVARPDLLYWLSFLGKRLVHNLTGKFDTIMQNFRSYHPHYDIFDLAKLAEEIISLNHQYGESWLIAGEIAGFVKNGVNNVLCLQPFGCIANHVIAKGVQKRMKELYPQLNLLFLDCDAGVSPVNFFNRMHFFVNHAKKAEALTPSHLPG